MRTINLTNGTHPLHAKDIRRLILCEHVSDAEKISRMGDITNQFAVIPVCGKLISKELSDLLAGVNVEKVYFYSCSPKTIRYIQSRFFRLNSEILPDSFFDSADGIVRIQELLDEYFADDPQNSHSGFCKNESNKRLFKGACADFVILGNIGTEPSSLQITLKVIFPCGRFHVWSLNLYSHNERQRVADTAFSLGYAAGAIEKDLMDLTELTEKERDMDTDRILPVNRNIKPYYNHERERELKAFLCSENLLEGIDAKLTRSGLPGETENKMLAFLGVISMKQLNPLHIILCGSSGSGKSHLMHVLADCLPDEYVFSLTRLSSKAFYYMHSHDLHEKALFIEDMDGLPAECLFALRELQSAKSVSVFRPYSDPGSGLMKTKIHRLTANFSSLTATTKADIYTDNLSRSILLFMDESDEQVKRILEYQNRKSAGLISHDSEIHARNFLKDAFLQLRTYEVVNPYAGCINLAETGVVSPRVNALFHSLTEQITLLFQFSRKTDAEGRLISTAGDVMAASKMFSGILCTKQDPLKPSLRRFFERLKELRKQQDGFLPFRQQDIRTPLNLSKSQTQQYLSLLKEAGYLKITGGTANKGYIYAISESGDLRERRAKVEECLMRQINSMIQKQKI